MKKIYQAPRMKETRLSNSTEILVASKRDTTKDVFSRKHDAMFDDMEEEW